MPRPKANPFPEGSDEYNEREEELAVQRALRESQPKPTSRRLTVEVSMATVETAKMLAVLVGDDTDYRQVIAAAANDMVEAKAEKVRELLAEGAPF
jgi:hypothetical protein